MDSQGIVIALLPFLIYIETSNTLECFNNKTGVCCQDYGNVSGKCEACIGSWGKECRNNCSYGHYGFGCRKKCNCSYRQTCNPREGCIEPFDASAAASSINSNPDLSTREASLLVISGLLILLLLCTILICYKKMKKQSERIQLSAGQKVFYEEIRVSGIVDNGGEYDTCLQT